MRTKANRHIYRNEAIDWAKSVFSEPSKYVILDTETTGIGDDDVVVHVGVMDLEGNMLVNTFVKPTKKTISKEAQAVNKIKVENLEAAPCFKDVLPLLESAWEGKEVLIYSAIFHANALRQTCKSDGLKIPEKLRESLTCVQNYFSDYLMKHYDYRMYLTMPGRKNTGEGDCRAALKVLKEISGGEYATEPPPGLKTEVRIISVEETTEPIMPTKPKKDWVLFLVVAAIFFALYLLFKNAIK